MRNVLKLFKAVLILGFLVGCSGCGGGGSSSGGSDKNTPTFSYFSDFDDSSYGIDYINSSKDYYSVGSSKASSFINYLISNFLPGSYGEYTWSNVSLGINATARVDTRSDDITLNLYGDGTVQHNDTLYKDIFGSFDISTLSYADVDKGYHNDLTIEFSDYLAELCDNTNQLENCISGGGIWNGYKEVGNFKYIWRGEVGFGNSRATWTILKI